MNASVARPASLRWRIAVARVHHAIGWAGWAGLAMLLAAALIAATARPAPRLGLPATTNPAVPVRVARDTSAPLTLPPRSEVPLLLTQMQQAAVAQGLAWPAAEYHVLPAGENEPAMLEVRCTLKGSYPQLRALLSQWIGTVPGLALREVAMSRKTADSAEVEARLSIGIYLAEAR